MEDLYTFEGEQIDSFLVKLPTITLESDNPISRDSYLTLELDVRIKSVRVDEDRSGRLVRHHVLAVDGAKIKSISKTKNVLDDIAPLPPHVEAEDV